MLYLKSTVSYPVLNLSINVTAQFKHIREIEYITFKKRIQSDRYKAIFHILRK